MAAQIILGHVFDWLKISSICDVGCGVGTWLAVARALGAETVRGCEGPWAADAPLAVEPAVIDFQDLEDPIALAGSYDLVLCLEVAEHLSARRSDRFVVELCGLGDVVAFSAAVPAQGGTGHVNERWQSEWAALFGAQGFDVYDPLRPLIWDNDKIDWWYRQNLLLYARRGSTAAQALAEAGIKRPQYVDVVHPAMFAHAERSQLRRGLKKSIRKLLGRDA